MRYSWALFLFLGFFAGAAHGDAAPVLLFPGVTHAGGGAASGSTVVLYNATATPQSILLELLPHGGAIASATRSVQLGPGESLQIADLHAFLGAAGGIGMLRVTGSVVATVRVRDQDDEAVLKELPAVNPGQAIAANEEVDFPYSTPADMERDARSNLILVNLDARDVTVTMSQGSMTARKTIPAGAFVRIDNLGGFVGTPAGIASAHAVADGRWFGLITTIDATGTQRRRASRPPGQPPSSFGLIDKALAAGAINAEQALTYKVFADFNDSRLPASLKGDDSGTVEMDSPGLAAQQWPTLSPTTQDLIGPFLVPPFYEGSWWDLRRTAASASAIRPLAACRPWATVELCNIISDWTFQAGSHVRVWYERSSAADASVASDMVHEVDVKIWAELIKVMGREPIFDHEINGTNLLDVVLTDVLGARELGTTMGLHLLSCRKDPTFIMMNRNITNIPFRRSALAHELFHAVQHTYNTQSCLESNYKWLMESTATWFEDELYPTVNREQSFAPSYLSTTSLSLDAPKDVDRRYGAYAFFFYLTRIRTPNASNAVRYVWEATESGDALHALDAGLTRAGAPLDKSWPDFAVYSWNVDAPYNLYTTTDSLTDKADIESLQPISVPKGDGKAELGDNQLSLPHLSIRYYQFDFVDATASSVVFYNGIQRALDATPVTWIENFGNVLTAKLVSDPASIKGAHVDALLKIDGKWTHEDWTGEPFKTFCRDLKAERIESLVIILSNSDIASTLQPQGKYPPIVQATNIGCYAWEGSADLTFEEDGRIEKMTVSNLRLEALGDVPDAEDTPLRRLFSVTAGTFRWSISGATDGCTWSAPAVDESLGLGNFLYTFPYAKTPAAGARGILPLLFQEWLQVRLIVKQTGPTCYTGLDDWKATAFFLILEPQKSHAQVSSDGKSYTLDASRAVPNSGVTGTWRFTAKRE